MNELKAAPVIQIENVRPRVEGDRYASKGVMGEWCVVTADIFREGFHIVRAVVKWRKKSETVFHEEPMTPLPNDAWAGKFILQENAAYIYLIEAWTDGYPDSVTRSAELEIFSDRPGAAYGAWYEFFIRSHGTFREAEERLKVIKQNGTLDAILKKYGIK